MKKQLNVLGLILIGIMLNGCAVFAPRTEFAPAVVTQTYQARTPAEKIELFRSQMPSKKYSEIGSLRACCSTYTNLLIDSMRQRAAESGGDALVALEIDANGGVSASVIRYNENP